VLEDLVPPAVQYHGQGSKHVMCAAGNSMRAIKAIGIAASMRHQAFKGWQVARVTLIGSPFFLLSHRPWLTIGAGWGWGTPPAWHHTSSSQGLLRLRAGRSRTQNLRAGLAAGRGRLHASTCCTDHIGSIGRCIPLPRLLRTRSRLCLASCSSGV
jgi:hypothetical protein